MYSSMQKLLKVQKMLMNKEEEVEQVDMMSLMKNKWKMNKEDTIIIYSSNLLKMFKIIGVLKVKNLIVLIQTLAFMDLQVRIMFILCLLDIP